LNKKYFNSSFVNLAEHYHHLDAEENLSVIDLPPNPCCFRMKDAGEHMNK
jgi:hypothetical protein